MPQARVVLKCAALLAGCLSLFATVGCGSGGSATVFSPQGNFSTSSLKGAYVYQIHGGDATNLSPYREVGVFIADGQGHLSTPGSDDASFSPTATPVTGSYQIFQDGTGTISMTTELGNVTLAVTMVSNSKLYLMEADASLNAVGVAELQDPTAISTTPAGSFAFRIHEEVSLNNQTPTAQVGAFTVPGSGINGAMDQNGGGTFSSPQLTWTFGAPNALGRGTGTYLNSSTSVTSNFVYYIVNSSEVALLVSDASVVGSGVAEGQSGAIGSGLSGTYAFGSSGDDANSQQGLFGTVAAVGEFNAASGSISGTEDTNIDNTPTANAPITSCFSASANGRVVVNSVSGNTCSATTTQVFWMVNPSRAFFLDVNGALFDDGTADLQTVSNFSQGTIKGQYAMVMGGIDASQTALGLPVQLLSRVGAMQFDGTSKITVDEASNASNSGPNSPGVLAGNYTVSSNGRITGGFGNSGGGVDFVMYGVSGSKAYILQNDPQTITSGTIELQP